MLEQRIVFAMTPTGLHGDRNPPLVTPCLQPKRDKALPWRCRQYRSIFESRLDELPSFARVLHPDVVGRLQQGHGNHPRFALAEPHQHKEVHVDIIEWNPFVLQVRAYFASEVGQVPTVHPVTCAHKRFQKKFGM